MIRSKYVLEYSKEINSLLGRKKTSPPSLIEDPKTVLKVVNYVLELLQFVSLCLLYLDLMFALCEFYDRMLRSQAL